jgi:peptidoglycan/LPS O-acetylase OafA/YrhL
MTLRRVADALTILGFVVLVLALVTTNGSLALLGVVLIVASIALALVRRATHRS